MPCEVRSVKTRFGDYFCCAVESLRKLRLHSSRGGGGGTRAQSVSMDGFLAVHTSVLSHMSLLETKGKCQFTLPYLYHYILAYFLVFLSIDQ